VSARRLPTAAVSALLAILMVGAVLAVFAPMARAASIPPQAERYRRDLIRSAYYVFGMAAPVALLAGQVHQESAWNPMAKSAYASGLAQFTPGTARDMARLHPQELGRSSPNGVPTDPRWALLALCIYDKALYDAAAFAATDGDRWRFALWGYNGGWGWVQKDRAKAKAQGLNPNSAADVAQVNNGRAAEFFRENRNYDKAIDRHQWLYLPWGPGVTMRGVP
jgi:soluble lytic murein transglycosylase-like protein